MTAPQRIGVFGVGNVLMGDDGIGPFVVKILESRYEFPTNVAPGDVRQYRKPQLVSVPIPQRVSPHDPALVEALLFAEFSGKCLQKSCSLASFRKPRNWAAASLKK